MGYSTDFYGKFKLKNQLSDYLFNYINTFSSTRRMKRDNEKIKEIYSDWKERCLYGYLGEEGEFFIYDDPEFYQYIDESIIDPNNPPKTQPGLWCQWIVEKINDKDYILWDNNEKFYHYIEWLKYIIENFIIPSDNKLNGYVFFEGENFKDIGLIEVKNNKIKTYGPTDITKTLLRKVNVDEATFEKMYKKLTDVKSKLF